MRAVILGAGPSMTLGFRFKGWHVIAIGRTVTLVDPTEYDVAYLGDTMSHPFLESIPLDKPLVVRDAFEHKHRQLLADSERRTPIVHTPLAGDRYHGTGPNCGSWVLRELRPARLMLVGCDCTGASYDLQREGWAQIKRKWDGQQINEIPGSQCGIFRNLVKKGRGR